MSFSVNDQLDQRIEFNTVPTRIVSLVPSITEYLYYLQLHKQIIAQTIFCIHPHENFKDAIKIGGTKKLQISKIKSLKPDLIIANKEENVKEQIAQLKNTAPIYISDVNTLPQAIEMMEHIAIITNTDSIAKPLIANIKQQLRQLHNAFSSTFIYLIWKDPYFAVGSKTYINELLQHMGLQNCICNQRYPQLSIEQIKQLKPEFLFLSTEPFPFKQSDLQTIQAQLPNTKVKIIDGEMCSWYGSRMAQLQNYFTNYFAT